MTIRQSGHLRRERYFFASTRPFAHTHTVGDILLGVVINMLFLCIIHTHGKPRVRDFPCKTSYPIHSYLEHYSVMSGTFKRFQYPEGKD